jgi:hypothetical protein
MKRAGDASGYRAWAQAAAPRSAAGILRRQFCLRFRCFECVCDSLDDTMEVFDVVRDGTELVWLY